MDRLENLLREGSKVLTLGLEGYVVNKLTGEAKNFTASMQQERKVAAAKAGLGPEKASN